MAIEKAAKALSVLSYQSFYVYFCKRVILQKNPMAIEENASAATIKTIMEDAPISNELLNFFIVQVKEEISILNQIM